METTIDPRVLIDKATTDLDLARKEILRLRSELAKAQPSLLHNDIRLYFFTQIENVLLDTIIAFKLSLELSSEEWWFKNFSEVHVEKIPDRISIFQKSLKINLINLPYNLTEDAFRQLLRAVNPDSCNGGKGPFPNVYECLFKAAEVEYDKSLFELYRNVRNCQHNNGYYFPDKVTQSKDIAYRGIMYHFPYGKQVKYPDSGLPILDILKDLASLCFNICQSKKLKEISDIREANSIV